MFLGQVSPRLSVKQDQESRVDLEKSTKKSSDSEKFLTSPKAKAFIKRWSQKKNEDGKPLYTKRGVSALLKALFRNPEAEKDEDILDEAEELLGMLGGMDGLKGFLAGWKAKSEGLMKGIKGMLGGKVKE